MSNHIEHDQIEPIVRKLFEEITNHFYNPKNPNYLSTADVKNEKLEIAMADGNLIHIPNDISILKDSESRTYKIVKHDSDINEESTLISEFNTSDDPANKVFVGKNSSELYQTLNTIEETLSKVKTFNEKHDLLSSLKKNETQSKKSKLKM
jgi:hypothetical protein